MTFTFLRDNFYSDLLPFFADEQGVIRGPAGDGRVAAVARADVADVAAAVLRSPADHADATYVLTGPEALTLTEVAARAGAVLGRALRFEDETVEDGVRVPQGGVRRRGLAARRLGVDLHRDPGRLLRRGDRRRRAGDRPPGADDRRGDPGELPGG